MMYAIVDIETTGGYAAANGITEIAILIHDGEKVIDRYETLINPQADIPDYIQALTGIDNEMVKHAPTFDKVARDIFTLLSDSIFVAHNVNFDYSFVKHYLAQEGFNLQSKKLCTVRLSKKIIPGFPSYSLGKLCNSLNIPINNRHRAGGDAEATAILFSMLLAKDTEKVISQSLNKNSKEQVLPANLPREQFLNLPQSPGVYYFKDQKGKVIYVGKAINIKKRVTSHFSGNSASKQRQDFMRDIHAIDHETCATELMALILEANEIKRLWPNNNRALKRYEQKYGLYAYEDQKGLIRLTVDKHKKFMTAHHYFNNLMNGAIILQNLVKEFELCPKLCFIQKNNNTCIGIEGNYCKGVCEDLENVEEYNQRVNLALNQLKNTLPSFVLKDEGRNENELSYLLVEQGKFIGMTCLANDIQIANIETLKEYIKPYPSNDYILNIILSHAEMYPEKTEWF